ncbi:hypothetical protein DHEL01_v204414 [Diaporthe helianthi]|uniref:Uncharacterized protein n=1 Tax=Diaporthe helianthi TaxID=158607 RepID=A0A2P5I3V6_DIAHE|nr:hypothetical protein DHEL01_v204414 [Diaporthe helianthi]
MILPESSSRRHDAAARIDEIRRVWEARGDGEMGDKEMSRTEQEHEEGGDGGVEVRREENIVTLRSLFFLAAHDLAEKKTQRKPGRIRGLCQFIS